MRGGNVANNHQNNNFDFHYEELAERYERDINRLYFERKRKLQIIILLDLICSLALFFCFFLFFNLFFIYFLNHNYNNK